MAIIPLRAYNREIEGLIENGQLDEAVAHCRHILATFPKHIGTYRLLGKTHLEQQRVSDAIDIFQRVLSAIPDDFVSNLGMSIIREDENNLDASIWHMELAYEAEPSNVAVQDELRRLYGRRDGMEPPKVRLTRGALARMYAKGGLFDQAIAELRAAISEDPNRPDLQLLLAQMYFQTFQRVEAVETSVNILKKLPLCLVANQILAVSLPDAQRAEASRNYRQIAITMDPYFAFAEPDAVDSEKVPEEAVNLEKLEWKPGLKIGDNVTQPSWATSLGLSIEKPTEEKLPDWLKGAEAPPVDEPVEKPQPSVSPFIWDTQEVEKIAAEAPKPGQEIPDWMKDAGWKPASGEPADEVKPEEVEAAAEPALQAEDLEKGDIPEWLRGIAPEGVLEEKQAGDKPEGEEVPTPWLEEHQPGPTDSIIQWLDEKKPTMPHIEPPTAEARIGLPDEEVPDWLKDLDLPKPSSLSSESPSEIAPAVIPPAFLGEPQTSDQPSGQSIPQSIPPTEPTLPTSQVTPAEAPPPAEGSKSEGLSALLGDDLPDWLKELAGETVTPPAVEEAAEEKKEDIVRAIVEEPAVEIPAEPVPAPEPEIPGVPEEVIAAIPEEAVEAPAPEVPAPETIPTEAVPEVSAEMPLAEQPPAEEIAAVELPATEVPAEEAATVVEAPAVEEAIQPLEPAPAQIEEQVPIATPVPEEILPVSETPAEGEEVGSLAWLEDLIREEATKPEATPSLEGEPAPPEWVNLEEAPAEPAQPEPAAPIAEVPAIHAAEIPEWIKGLGEPPAEPPAPAPTETPVSETAEAEIPPAEELPAWLEEMEAPVEEKQPVLPAEEALEWKEEELPDWLKEIAETAPAEEKPATPEQITVGEGLAAAVIPAGEWTAEEPAEMRPVEQEPLQAEQAPVELGVAQEAEAPAQPIEVPAVQAEPVELKAVPVEIKAAEPVAEIAAPVETKPEEETAALFATALADCRSAVEQGMPDQAASKYSDLIKHQYQLEDIIKDLQAVLDRYPVNIDLWISFGDAHFRMDKLQEALDAYTKAEELAR